MQHLLRIAAVALYAGTSASAAFANSNLVTNQKLSWEVADKLASTAVRSCAAQGYSVTAAVVDPSGHEQALIRGTRFRCSCSPCLTAKCSRRSPTGRRSTRTRSVN